MRQFFTEQASFADIYLDQLEGRSCGDIVELPLEIRVFMVYKDLKTDPHEDFCVFELDEMQTRSI